MCFYLVTWYVFGGLEDQGHPPLWDIEEFFAASGLKFTVYFAVSYGLYQAGKRVSSSSLWLIIILSFVSFILLTTLVENCLLGAIGWANFFGGRSVAIGYLIAVLFFGLQTLLFFYFAAVAENKVLMAPPGEARVEEVVRLKVKKGEVAYFPELREVISVSAYGNYCKLDIAGEVYLYGGGIGKFCAAYGAQGFIRVHRGHAVNENHVVFLRQRGRQLEVELTDDSILPVGAAYRKNLAAFS